MGFLGDSKVERYVDRKLDKAEDVIKKKKHHAHKWYHSVIGRKVGGRVRRVTVVNRAGGRKEGSVSYRSEPGRKEGSASYRGEPGRKEGSANYRGEPGRKEGSTS
uniref:Uncharacterized protein n=1 Tax=Timema genevievae TaxID=629358 RepID=A0A7R9K304_TIMGE|nr:unnamed protein product [Timema genevievae]